MAPLLFAPVSGSAVTEAKGRVGDTGCKPTQELIQGRVRAVCLIETLSRRRGDKAISILGFRQLRIMGSHVNLSWAYRCPASMVGPFFGVVMSDANTSWVIFREDGQTVDFGRLRFELPRRDRGKKASFVVQMSKSLLSLNLLGTRYPCSWSLRVTADNYSAVNLWKPVKHDYPNDPLFTYQWPLENVGQYGGTTGADIQILDAWRITHCSPTIVIAVVDSGVARIADLRSNLAPGASFVPRHRATEDPFAHGTAVAAVAAAETNNHKGMAGVCPLGRIMPVKIPFSGPSLGARQAAAKGIRWAVDHGARIINLSLAFRKDYPGMRQAVAYAYEHNVVVVTAAGNSGHLTHTYPQNYPHVLVAGGSTRRDQRWDSSSYGPQDLVLAPSQDVLAPSFHGGFDITSETSFASPEVAGLAGLILSIRPDLKVDQVISAIEQGADPVQAQTGYDLKDGYGRIDCYRSLLIANVMPTTASR